MVEQLTAYPEYTAILASILAVPDDDLPRLALADWLDEHSEGERAEFIRIGIEIERLHGTACRLHDPVTTLPIIHGPIYDLRQRERAIWREWSRRWFGWGTGTENFGSALTPNEVDPRVRRGFVAEVRMPVAAFLSAAKGLFSTHPVERVVLTDREPGGIRYGVTVDLPGPYQTGPGAGQVGYGTFWRWFMENEMAGGVADNPTVLPGAIWRLFHDYPPHSTSILRRTLGWEFASRDEALVALSHACVAYGRGLAGLPPLEAAG